MTLAAAPFVSLTNRSAVIGKHIDGSQRTDNARHDRTPSPAELSVAALHWFTGAKAEARRAAALGCYFSINAETMHSGRGPALVAELPMDRLLTETDDPFTQIGGRSTESTDAPKTIGAIARGRNLASTTMDDHDLGLLANAIANVPTDN